MYLNFINYINGIKVLTTFCIFFFQSITSDVHMYNGVFFLQKKGSSTYSDIKINKIPLRRLSRRRKIDPDLPVVEGEIQLPLYRDDPNMKDLPPLQRVHRKRKQMYWSDMFGDIHGGQSIDLEAINRVRMSENKWKLLLEELYADKQYFDYARSMYIIIR